MIKIKDLRETDKGRTMVYVNGIGDIEKGHLISWDQKSIFVDFKTSRGKGTPLNPEDLLFWIKEVK